MRKVPIWEIWGRPTLDEHGVRVLEAKSSPEASSKQLFTCGSILETFLASYQLLSLPGSILLPTQAALGTRGSVPTPTALIESVIIGA